MNNEVARFIVSSVTSYPFFVFLCDESNISFNRLLIVAILKVFFFKKV